MKFVKLISIAVKYLFLIGFICLQLLSIYTAAVNPSDGTEQTVKIWQAALLIAVTLGIMGNLFTIDQLSKLITGKRQTLLTDLVEKDSKEISASYNGFIVFSLFLPVMVMSVYFYIHTNMRLFLIVGYILMIVSSVSVFVRLLALYIRSKQENKKTFLSKLVNPIVLPLIICFFLLLVTNNKTVGFVYRNLQTPTSTAVRIVAIIIVLCYVPAVAFCHYSNLYCITAFAFAMKDPKKFQAELDEAKRNDVERKESLQKLAEYVDETALRADFFSKIRLMIHFLFVHIRAYWEENVYTVSYLLSYGKLRITERLSGLLDRVQIKTHMIRFCEITVVLELLVLNMFLFIYLESDDPCARFFELLSTVIIIPILLSSLSNLKIKKGRQYL